MDTPRPKVLVVDDAPDNIRVLMETLCNEYAVVTAIDGERALRLAASQPRPDINRHGKLTNEEFKYMRRHTDIGHAVLLAAERRLGGNSFLRLARELAYTHHERWDGSGYPRGLCGEEIPLCGRLMAIADIYDALICRRVYKPPFPHEKAVDTIVAGRGTHFDPRLVGVFSALPRNSGASPWTLPTATRNGLPWLKGGQPRRDSDVEHRT